MVDLVKIRKKAKKQKEAEAAASAEAAAPVSGELDATPARIPETDAGPAADSPPPGAAARPEPESERIPQPRAAQEREDGAEASSKLDRFKAEAGKRRGVETEGRVGETGQSQLELLTFQIAGEQYAVDIERIIEIVTPRPVTRIPNTDPSVVGIMSLRGTIVTLVDVRRKLRHRGSGETGVDARIIVVELRSEIVGFEVDRVLRVVKAAPGDIQPHPVVHATELDESIFGVFRIAGALTILLDLDKLLDHRALAATRA